MKATIYVIAIFVVLTVIPLEVVGQSPYSSEPFKSAHLLEPAELLVESVSINNWLNENHEHLSEEQAAQVREYLFLLIGERVRSRFASTGATMGPDDLPVVPLLLRWASLLGAVGADLVASAYAPEMEPLELPEVLRAHERHFDVTFDDPFIVLSAKDDLWSVRVPFYFMVWQLARQEIEGHRTDILVASTLHSAHADHDGASQSTILFITSEEAAQSFSSRWLSRFGLDGANSTTSDWIEGGTTYSSLGDDTEMQVEAVIWEGEDRSFAAVYSGLSGPYRENYVHFRDFVNDLVR